MADKKTSKAANWSVASERHSDFKRSRERSDKVATKHFGHRDRVREKLLLGGMENALEHEILEYLLFGGIPYKDTKEIAYDLLRRFGNLYHVCNASYESLLETKSMTSNAALMLNSLVEVADRYAREKTQTDRAAGMGGVLSYLTGKEDPFGEACYVLKISESGEVEGVDEVRAGDGDALSVPTEAVLQTAVRTGGTRVIVVHNHPSGTVDASAIDYAYTYSLDCALKAAGITLTDHLIAFDKYAFSMKNRKLFDFDRRQEKCR